jgi:hypothetical protein
MNTSRRIGILFNETKDAALLISGVRRLHPDACIIAIVSPRVAFQEKPLADEVLLVELSPVRLFVKGDFLQMVNLLRNQKYELLIIRYSSLKLKVLGALVSPFRCEIWGQSGTIIPVEGSPASVFYSHFMARVMGIGTLIRIYVNIFFSKIR